MVLCLLFGNMFLFICAAGCDELIACHKATQQCLDTLLQHDIARKEALEENQQMIKIFSARKARPAVVGIVLALLCMALAVISGSSNQKTARAADPLLGRVWGSTATSISEMVPATVYGSTMMEEYNASGAPTGYLTIVGGSPFVTSTSARAEAEADGWYKRTWRYNPSTDTNVEGPSTLYPHYFSPGIKASDGFFYVIGSSNGPPNYGGSITGKTERFNYTTQRWESMPTLGTPRYGAFVFSPLNSNRIYALGGTTSSDGEGALKTGEYLQLNNLAAGWQPLPSTFNLPYPTWVGGVANGTAGKYIMAGGLHCASGTATGCGLGTPAPYTYEVSLSSQNPPTGTTTALPSTSNLVKTNYTASYLTLNDRLYAFGGWSLDEFGVNRQQSFVQYFDYATKKWLMTDNEMPNPHGGGSATQMADGRIYVGGGSSSYNVPSGADPSTIDTAYYSELQILNTSATINNDSSPVGTLNWNATTPETVTYTWNVRNPMAWDSFTLKSSLSDMPQGMVCPAISDRPAAGLATVLITVTCTLDRSSFYAPLTTAPMAGPTLKVYGMSNNYWGDRTPDERMAGASVNKANTVINVSITETLVLGTPNTLGATTADPGDQLILTTTFKNNTSDTITGLTPSSTLLTKAGVTPVLQSGSTTVAPGGITVYRTTLIARGEYFTGESPSKIQDTTSFTGKLGSASATAPLGSASASLNSTDVRWSVSNPSVSYVNDVAPAGLSAGDTVDFSVKAGNSGTNGLNVTSIRDRNGATPGKMYGVGATTSWTSTQSPAAAGTSSTVSTSGVSEQTYVVKPSDIVDGQFKLTIDASLGVPNCTTGCTWTDTTVMYLPAVNYVVSYDSTVTSVISNDTGKAGYVSAGDTVRYTVTIVARGSAPMTNVGLTSPLSGTWTCRKNGVATGNGSTYLSVGQSIVCSITVTATQSAMNAMSNPAVWSWAPTLSFTPDYGGTANSATLAASVLPMDKPNPSLSVTTNSTPSGTVSAGTSVSFNYTITNTGNVTLSSVGATTNDGLTVTCPKTSLVSGEAMSCSSSKTLW